MRLHRFMLIVVCAFVLVAGAPQANGAGGVAIMACGQMVTTNAYLTGDLYCPGLHGVIVGAHGITIDLKGFTLRGDRQDDYYGIYQSGFDKVTIKNGVVRNFDTGVAAPNNADSFSLVNLVVSGNAGRAIDITGTSAVVKSSTASANAGYGIYIFGDGAKIQSSSVTANSASGIVLFGASIKVQSSTASGNAGNGIELAGDKAVVKGNRAEANGFAVPDLSGTGISVYNFVTPPSGKNIARGNDDPNECNPTYLC